MRLAGILLLAGGVVGCASDQSATLPATAPLPPTTPRVTGVERAAQREHNRLVAAFGGQYQAPAAERDLEEVIARVVPATDRPDQTYKVTILNAPVVNAFALPTGNVYVTRGLLALANDNAEIAAVLAHEIAHVTAEHALARAELEQRAVLVSRVVSEVLNDPGAGKMIRSEGRVSLASFSRAQELEADRISVKTIGQAGYDPYGASRFLVSLGRNAGLKRTGKSGDMDFLSSHPSTPERIAQAIKSARQFGTPGIGERQKARYLSAINGIVYGEDPAEGVIRGRRFLHPRLAVTFVAPEGFALENSSEAVLGVSPAGGQALRFDGVQVPSSQSLEEFMRSGWIEGLETDSVQVTTVNGLPAATAIAHGREWTFFLGAVRMGDTTYRLLLASRTASSQARATFNSAFESIQQLTPAEAAAVRPYRISIITAEFGDTPETMARRMALPDGPLDRFLTLNGLEKGDALKPGERYKIITE